MKLLAVTFAGSGRQCHQCGTVVYRINKAKTCLPTEKISPAKISTFLPLKCLKENDAFNTGFYAQVVKQCSYGEFAQFCARYATPLSATSRYRGSCRTGGRNTRLYLREPQCVEITTSSALGCLHETDFSPLCHILMPKICLHSDFPCGGGKDGMSNSVKMAAALPGQR